MRARSSRVGGGGDRRRRSDPRASPRGRRRRPRPRCRARAGGFVAPMRPEHEDDQDRRAPPRGCPGPCSRPPAMISAGAEARRRGGDQMSASATPWTRVRSWSSRCSESSALPATNPRFQPQPSRNSATSSTKPPSGGASAAMSDAVARRAVPRKIVGTAQAVGQAARERRQRVHPERVAGEDDPDGGQRVAVLGHVERGHRHDQDHHELADDERDDRRAHAGPAEDRRRSARACGRCRRASSSSVAAIGELVRVGPEEREREDGRGAHEHDRHEVRPREHRQPEVHRRSAGDRGERRPDDRADRRRPHDEPDRRGAARGRGHVRVRVPREVVARVPEADEQRPDQEQREQRAHDGGGRDERADHADRVARRQPDPPRAPRHERREQDRAQGGAEDDGRARARRRASGSRACPGATIVATVTAAMWPVLPSATPR